MPVSRVSSAAAATTNDVRSIATNELNVNSADLAKAVMLPKFLYKGPSAGKIIMDAVVEDTKNMGGDNSCQIDIGI